MNLYKETLIFISKRDPHRIYMNWLAHHLKVDIDYPTFARLCRKLFDDNYIFYDCGSPTGVNNWLMKR